ncbi:hypothetical protein CLV28_0518 [Sediminihabitans luteus]|uniref:Uncharacterized protein n=1 Tax=Sediminihabitans luteus TaxID=1138585 RepID=A0A2M9CZF0_9CELL|nr:hypothetical protein [Sediminihabitans luteus]PJJ77299.1 hypothetical protein CLV28_0518 [Sediminihabitans luteus]GII98750.1 hypothetical protein Slu03_11280 [Sediminihabitans luteus]
MTNDSLVRALPLQAADVALWRARPPRLVLPALGWAGIVAVCARDIVAEFSLPAIPYPAELVEDPVYWLTGLLVGRALGLLVVLGVAPRVGLWLTALWAGAFATVAWPPTVPWCAVVALALTVCALVASSTPARQASAAAGWAVRAPRAVPDGHPGVLGHHLRAWPARAVTGVVLLSVGAAAVGLWLHDDAAARAFRASATVAPGTVLEVDEDSVTVAVGPDDGTADGAVELQVPTPTLDRTVGESVEVRYSPGRAELVDDVFDPAMPLLAVGALVPPGAVLLVTARRRRRARRHLLDDGGAAVLMHATWHAGGVVLTAVDDPAPVVLADDVEGLALLPDGPDSTDPWEELAHRAVTEVDDDELLRMAAAGVDDHDQDAAPGTDPAAPDHWARTPVVVVGLVRDGAPLALQGPDGAWYLATAGNPVAWPGRGGLPLAPVNDDEADGTLAPGTPSVSDLSDDIGHGNGVDSLDPTGTTDERTADEGTSDAGTPAPTGAGPVLRAARRTGSLGPWLAVPVLALVGVLVLADSPWYLVAGGAATAAWWGSAWSGAPLPWARPTSRGLVLRSGVLDTVLPWSRVERVVADELSVVVRVSATRVSPADAYWCAQHDPSLPLVRGTSTPEEACDAVRRAQAAAPASADTDVRRRPSRPAVVGALWAAALVVGTLLAG